MNTFISAKISGGSIHSPFSSFQREFMAESIKLENVECEMLGEDILVKAEVRRT